MSRVYLHKETSVVWNHVISPVYAGGEKGLLVNVDIETKLEKLLTVAKNNSQD